MLGNSRYRVAVLIAILVAMLVSWALVSKYFLDAVKRAKSNEAFAVFNTLTQNQKYEFLQKLMDEEGLDAGSLLLELAGTPSAGGLPYFLGRYVYGKYGANGITLCPPAFFLGCRAGVLRAAIMEKGPGAVKEFDEACRHVAGSGRSCGHGLGHGYAEFTHFNIPESLNLCDRLESYAQIPCYGGVFQEYLEFAPVKMFPKDDVWHPCIGLADKYRSVCAFTLRDLWSLRYQFDDSKSITLCLSSDDKTIKVSCLLGVGFRILKDSDGEAGDVVNRCNYLFPEKYRPLCFISAANVLGVYTYPDWENSVEVLCRELDVELASICRAAARSNTVFKTDELLKDYQF